MRQTLLRIRALILAAAMLVSMTGCGSTNNKKEESMKAPTTVELQNRPQKGSMSAVTLADIPAYAGEPYAVINDNNPFFTEEEIAKATTSWEEYGDMDKLGRCSMCWASVGKDLMPTGERGSIGAVKPTGWHTVKYDFVNGKYLYNRSHLIGWQLTGENANEKNLVTGTRSFNVDGMLPFENMVADYVREDDGRVLYRVTPMFDGDDLVCRGVLMEAISVEDDGDSVLFNVFVYNVQPGVKINYATGESSLDNGQTTEAGDSDSKAATNADTTYVINTNSMKFHKEDCSSISSMNPANKKAVTSTRDKLVSEGYSPCGICKP